MPVIVGIWLQMRRASAGDLGSAGGGLTYFVFF